MRYLDKKIASSFVVAKKMFISQRDAFEELSSSFPEEVVSGWANEPTEAMLVDEKWQSPFYEQDAPGV